MYFYHFSRISPNLYPTPTLYGRDQSFHTSAVRTARARAELRTVVLGRFHVISKYQAELPNYTVISAAPRISCHLPRESPCALYTYSTHGRSLSPHTHTHRRTHRRSRHVPTCTCYMLQHMCMSCVHMYSRRSLHFTIKFLPIFGRYNRRQRAGSTHTHAVWRTAAAAEAAPAEGGGGGGGGRRWWWCLGGTGRLRRA